MKAHLAWGGSLCLQHFYTASCEHSHSYTAFYKASHPYTASYKAGWSDNMLYTFHVTRNSQHHTGRCQSSVECQKRGSRVAISMSNVHASSFCVPSATFSDVLLQSQRSHSGNLNVQNSSSEFDGQGKCFSRLFCSQIKEANCPKLSNLTITICL